MIQFFCDNCGQSVSHTEVMGPGVPDLFPKTFEWKHSSGLVILVSLAKENTTQHFCKGCMWRVIQDMLDEIGPVEYADDRPDDLYPEDVDRDSSGKGETVSKLRIEDILPGASTGVPQSFTDRIRAEVRRHWGSPWPNGRSKGDSVRRTRWPMAKGKTTRQQSRSEPRVLP